MAKAPGWNAPDGEGRKPGERTGLDMGSGSEDKIIMEPKKDFRYIYNQIINDPDKARKLARLLGIVHGDGNASYERILITDKSKDFHEVLRRLFIDIFQITPNLYNDKKRNTYYTHTKNKAVYWILTEKLAVNKGSIRKRIIIPGFIQKNNIIIQREYVGGLFDAEASVKKRQAEIAFSTTSENLFEFIKEILTRSGIKFSTNVRHRRKNPEYEIYIYGKTNLSIFQEKIGFTHPKKKMMLILHITPRSHTH